MKRETRLPATPASARAARSMVREAATQAGLKDEPAWDAMLATTEAVTNAIKHGMAGPDDGILFVTAPCRRGLRVEVSNLGTIDRPLEPAPLDATSGRGIQIIAALVDRLEISSGNGRTVVRFEKHRARIVRRLATSYRGSRVRAA